MLYKCLPFLLSIPMLIYQEISLWLAHGILGSDDSQPGNSRFQVNPSRRSRTLPTPLDEAPAQHYGKEGEGRNVKYKTNHLHITAWVPI